MAAEWADARLLIFSNSVCYTLVHYWHSFVFALFRGFTCQELLSFRLTNRSAVAHHHRGHAPDWSVAVSASCLHRPRSCASLNTEFNPWLGGLWSSSSVRSHVWRGRPGRRFQFLGSPLIDVGLCRALNVSYESPILAACPKKQNRVIWMSDISCGWESRVMFIM